VATELLSELQHLPCFLLMEFVEGSKLLDCPQAVDPVRVQPHLTAGPELKPAAAASHMSQLISSHRAPSLDIMGMCHLFVHYLPGLGDMHMQRCDRSTDWCKP
jgi:hypothetical protein